MRIIRVACAWLCACAVTTAAELRPPMLADGFLEIDTPDFSVKLVRSSQTAAALLPKEAKGFDFTPGDRLEKRSGDGFHHLGDLTLRLRKSGDDVWRDLDTAAARRPVTAMPAAGNVLAAADLAPSLPDDCPVQIIRSWELAGSKRLALRFEIKNTSSDTIEIGALGMPMVFNNIITDRSLEEAHEVCSFSDPSIGQDAGFLQVTRLSGKGPALVVVPDGITPFEAYQPLDEPMPRQQTFEGVLSWMVHSRAYAEKEWKDAQPWNPPTSVTLKPGQSRSYGVRFLLAPEIRDIEATLAANQRPVAVGIPGYVLPTDLDARLFLKYGSKVEHIAVEPKDAVAIRKDEPTGNGWQAYTLRGKTWGRARISITYEDGLRQSISYLVTKPAAMAVRDLGNFLMTKQWFVDSNDPFHRSPSVISYDRELDQQLRQESRVWIAGLGDEGGSGSWLAAAMKQFVQPDPKEIAKFEQFIDRVLWGVLQIKDGPNRYGVRKSAFYYEPKALPDFDYESRFDWRSWTSWNKQHSEDIGRGYNYPHVVAAYWSMYRIARNHPGVVKNHPWEWYLNQAYQTTRFAFSRDDNGRRKVGWVELGLMEGTIFLHLLDDLKREGWSEKAAEIEALMKERADRWKHEAYPFGSEMAWDSTGQEEVYAWCDYFGYDDKARVSLDSIIGYMPAVPHWGYNGNARRYWDFLYGGKIQRIERQLHHYGSALNSLPLLTHYRQHPGDFHLLRIGYAGAMAPLTNIDRDGFASAAFHSDPATLKWDAYSGDYGPGFLGHALNTATYLVQHPEFGWQAFGGNVQLEGDWIKVAPRDSLRKRVYLAPRGLWLTLDAGAFEAVELNRKTGAVRLGLLGGVTPVAQARLRIEQPARLPGVGNYQPVQELKQHNGIHEIDLKGIITWIELSERQLEETSAVHPKPQAVPYMAKPLPLSAVRLTGGPLKHAQDLNADYLLKLEPDRMLFHLRKRAGLVPKADDGYGGWDGGGRQLTGHIAGHYLSAVSYMYAATGDERFKERADYIVRELKEIQDKQGDGYIGGLMAEVRGNGEKILVDGKERFEELGKGVIESGGFDLNGMWSPWYVQHKIYAGLRDAYRLTGNRTALEVEVKFAEWADRILSKLDDEQIQKMLNTEFGAMNEIMADLYADTGDARWRKAYRYFEHRALIEPLANHEDILAGKHGNTQVPKLYGDLIYHIHTGDPKAGAAAKFFWETVAKNHSYATGGHGKDEYFGEPGKLGDRVDGRTAETCNVYNMLKMARTLFALRPDAEYAEFHERALFNHILSSIDDHDGRTCYMVPVGRGVTREYQDMFHSFTCCVGSGMESHALHGDGIYYESSDKLWVNLYAPSTAEWKTKGAKLNMETDFPEGESVRIKLELKSPQEFALALRRPAWAGEGFRVAVNGADVAALPAPGAYLEIQREWKTGDMVDLIIPKSLHAEPVPDNPQRMALMWGPLVLAGDLGPENPSERPEVPVLVSDSERVADWLKPVPDKTGVFRTAGVGRDRDVEFTPFYRLHRRTYAIYWDRFSSAEWKQREQEIAAEREKRRQLEAATVAFVQPGEMQAERDFNQQGEGSAPDRIMGRAARRGSNWFSFDVPVDSSKPAALIVTYYNDEWRKRTFDILVDGQRVGEQTVEKGGAPRFFDVEYPLPAESIRGKQKVTIRFQATQGNEIAAVFGIRMVRADALPGR